MKIELDALTIYEALNNPSLTPQDQFFSEAVSRLQEGETWKREETNVPLITREFHRRIDFFPPFTDMAVKFKRIGKAYTGTIIFELSDSSGEEIVSKKLKEVYGDNWIILGYEGRGTGFLRDKNRDVILALSDYNSYAPGKSISLVQSGAKDRPFDSLEDFTGDLYTLGTFLNKYVNIRMQMSHERAGAQMPPEDLTIKVG